MARVQLYYRTSGESLKTPRVSPPNPKTSPVRQMGGTCCDLKAVDHVFRSGGGWHVCGFTKEHLVFLLLKKNLKNIWSFSP